MTIAETKDAMQFAVTVTIRCKEDYNITLDTYNPALWLGIIESLYRIGEDTATATFCCVNSIQARRASA